MVLGKKKMQQITLIFSSEDQRNKAVKGLHASSFWSVAAAALLCSPADLQRTSKTFSRTVQPPIRPAPFPSPVPPCFSLHPGWHHHGGTHGPPHLLPITSRQKPSTKETPNGYEMERNNLGPWENISETSRASSQSGRGVDPRVIIWCDPGSRGLGRCVKHFLDVKYAWAEKTKFSAIRKGGNMRLFAALSEHMWEDALFLNSTFAELSTSDDTKSKRNEKMKPQPFCFCCCSWFSVSFSLFFNLGRFMLSHFQEAFLRDRWREICVSCPYFQSHKNMSNPRLSCSTILRSEVHWQSRSIKVKMWSTKCNRHRGDPLFRAAALILGFRWSSFRVAE